MLLDPSLKLGFANEGRLAGVGSLICNSERAKKSHYDATGHSVLSSTAKDLSICAKALTQDLK
jgi:hypothetical protein